MELLLGLVGLFLAGTLSWRLWSRRRSLPCPHWLGWMVEMDNPFTATNRASVIVGRLGLAPGMKILDAGCGPGRVTIPAARAVGEGGLVVALDLQPEMLARAAAKAEAAGLYNIEFRQAELERAGLAPESFDRALLVTVLGEIPDREAAMAEIFRALKPGGILSVTEVIFDPHFQTRKSVLRIARGAGFELAASHGHALAYCLDLKKPPGRTG